MGGGNAKNYNLGVASSEFMEFSPLWTLPRNKLVGSRRYLEGNQFHVSSFAPSDDLELPRPQLPAACTQGHGRMGVPVATLNSVDKHGRTRLGGLSASQIFRVLSA